MPFSYSTDEENYSGPFETREAAIEEAKLEKPQKFWTAENREPVIDFSLNAENVIEEIHQGEDFWIEQAEDWPDCSEEQKRELTNALRKTVLDWIERHSLKPTFWIADNVQEHKLAD